jgi:ATP-dependent protease ClpP protease subunit
LVLLNSTARMGTSGGESEDTNIHKESMAYTKTKLKRKIVDDGIISHINDYGLDVENREIFLFPREEYMYGGGEEALVEPGVEFGLANQFIRNLRILSNISDEPILVHLKSCGGDWIEGLAMYQAIKACPNHVTMLNYASARSMSSIIFSAADHRAMMPFSTFMIHTGSNCLVGTGTQVHTEYEEVLKADRIMFDIYIDLLKESEPMKGWTRKRVDTWITKKMKEKEEVYFSAEEAVEHNFADVVFGADGTYDWAALTKA